MLISFTRLGQFFGFELIVDAFEGGALGVVYRQSILTDAPVGSRKTFPQHPTSSKMSSEISRGASVRLLAILRGGLQPDESTVG